MNKIMIALLAGFAAGVLLAPDKGSVTRKKLNDGFDDLAGRLSDLAKEFTRENTTVSEEAAESHKMSVTV